MKKLLFAYFLTVFTLLAPPRGDAITVTDDTWVNTSGSWSDSTKWTSGFVPASSDSTTLHFGGSGSTQYLSTNDLGDPTTGFIFSQIELASTASVTEAISGSFNGKLAVGAFGSSILQNGTGAFDIFNDITSKDFGTGVLSTTTLNLSGSGAGVVTLKGNISDHSTTQKLGLSKDGTSTSVVIGINTYSAGTTVSGGTLLVNNTFGSGTGTGTVTVSNATLGGNGSIQVTSPLLPTDRLVTVNSGGIVAPGAQVGAIGTLQMQAFQVVFNSGSMFSVDLSPSSSDLLRISTGILNLAASGDIIQFNGTASSSPMIYTLATYDGFLSTFDTVNNLPSGYQLVYTPTELVLTNDLSLVPEPSTWVAAGLSLLAVGYSQRRRIFKTLKS